MKKQVAIIGRYSGDKFQTLFELLNEAASEGAIEYQKFNIDTCKDIPYSDFDAFIYVATTSKDKSKPFIHLPISSTEDQIINSVQELATQLFSKQKNLISDNPEPMMIDKAEVSFDISNNDREFDTLKGLVVVIDSKEIHLNKEDTYELRELLDLCKQYNWVVKNVLIEEK